MRELHHHTKKSTDEAAVTSLLMLQWENFC